MLAICVMCTTSEQIQTRVDDQGWIDYIHPATHVAYMLEVGLQFILTLLKKKPLSSM